MAVQIISGFSEYLTSLKQNNGNDYDVSQNNLSNYSNELNDYLENVLGVDVSSISMSPAELLTMDVADGKIVPHAESTMVDNQINPANTDYSLDELEVEKTADVNNKKVDENSAAEKSDDKNTDQQKDVGENYLSQAENYYALYDEGCITLEELKKEIEALEKDITELNKDIEDENKSIEEKKQEIEQKNKEIENEKKKLEDCNEDLEELAEKLAQEGLSSEEIQKNPQYSALKSNIEHLSSSISSLSNTLNSLSSQLKTKQNNVTSLEGDLNTSQNRLSSKNKEYDNVQKTVNRNYQSYVNANSNYSNYASSQGGFSTAGVASVKGGVGLENYDSAKGQAIANSALKLFGNDHKANGRCASGVSQSLKDATGVELHGNGCDWAELLEQRPDWGEIYYDSAEDLKGVYDPATGKGLPPGAIVCWSQYEPGHTGSNGRYGHVFIADGQGHEISDFISNVSTNYANWGGKFRVFIPIDQGA